MADNIWTKLYSRINWKNRPSKNTPINETNLGKIDYALDEIDNRILVLNKDVSDLQTELNRSLNGLSFSITENGILRVTY